MANSNFPFYGSNTFGIDSLNQFSINIFNPYSLYHYTVSIITPIFPLGEVSETPIPEVTFQDFLDWCGQYVDIDNEEHPLYRLLALLIDVAKEVVCIDLVGEKFFVRSVCYYAAHYLELHIKMLKEEANQSNLNPEQKDKEIKIEAIGSVKEDFKQTIPGVMFWSIYGHLARFSGRGKERIWGAF